MNASKTWLWCLACLCSLPAGSVPLNAAAQPELRWWKGNTHTHSLWSDGDAPPEVVVRYYRDHGYNFLVLSEHNVIADHEGFAETGERLQTLDELRRQFETEEFRLITGEEVTDRLGSTEVTFTAIHPSGLIAPQGGGNLVELGNRNLSAIAAQGALGVLNHPNYLYGWRPEEVAEVEADFFEVYNGHPETHNRGDSQHPSTEQIWDRALTERRQAGRPLLYGIATDDAHQFINIGSRTALPGRGWIVVRSPLLSAESLLQALRSGDFYASTGVVISDFGTDAHTYSVRIESQGGTS